MSEVTVYPVVVKPWIAEAGLTLKEQSALLSVLRGPDHGFCINVKKIQKEIRASIQHNADPTSDYMRQSLNNKQHTWGLDLKSLERELEFAPLHFVAHFIEGLELMARIGAEREIGRLCDYVLDWFASTFHFRYEHD